MTLVRRHWLTAYALLARCAGVPVRVVVGFPEVPAGRTTLDQGDVAAWVEVPVAGEGWTDRDPLPTPEEQERLAQLASERPEEPEPEPPEPSGTATMVPPTDPPTAGRDLGPALLALAQRLGRAGQGPLERDGRIDWLPGGLSGWTESRDMPALPAQSFREWWRTRGKQP